LPVRHVLGTRAFWASPDFAPGPDCQRWWVDEAKMRKISQLETPRPVWVAFDLPRPAWEPERFAGRWSLVLDGVRDPGNLGTLIRLADWFGMEQMLCSTDCADAFSPKVVQASAASVGRVRVSQRPLEEALPQLKALGLSCVGTFMEGHSLYGYPWPEAGLLVLGNEGQGIGPAVEALCDGRLSVPRFRPEARGPESLNVASAAAIVVAELNRPRP